MSFLYDMFFWTGFGMSRLRYELMGKPGLKVGQRDSCLYLIDSYDFYLVGLYLAGACLRTIRFEVKHMCSFVQGKHAARRVSAPILAEQNNDGS